MTDLFLPRRLQRQIEDKLEQYEDIRQMAEGTGGFDYSKVKVITSPGQGAGFEQKLLIAEELLEEVRELTAQRDEAAAEILKVSARINDVKFRAVLDLWHVLMKSNHQIADELGLSLRTVKRRLAIARSLFRNIDRNIESK